MKNFAFSPLLKVFWSWLRYAFSSLHCVCQSTVWLTVLIVVTLNISLHYLITDCLRWKGKRIDNLCPFVSASICLHSTSFLLNQLTCKLEFLYMYGLWHYPPPLRLKVIVIHVGVKVRGEGYGWVLNDGHNGMFLLSRHHLHASFTKPAAWCGQGQQQQSSPVHVVML